MREMILKRTDFGELSAKVLSRGGSFCFRARGFSMVPFIQDRDILTIEPVKASALDMGDVAFYRLAADRLVAHRVVGREMQGGGQEILTMRADASSGSYDRVLAEQVLGRVVGVQRGEKLIRPDRGFRRLMALLLVRGSPVSSLIFWPVRTVKRILVWFLQQIRALKPYRVLARKLIGEKVRCCVATAEDSPGLSRFYGYKRFPELRDPVEAFKRQLDNLEGIGYYLITRVGGRIAGATVIRRFPENESLYTDWWIFGMLVRTRYRGAGIGEGMVHMALQKASEEGAAKINILVFEHNKAAINLYRKNGFLQTSIPGLDDQLEKEVKLGKNRRIIMSRSLKKNIKIIPDVSLGE
jgi:RimJ/RimL family protein N-acetyltransferase